uniref:Uncharacterized protein n=1 Tax=Panagrolaimus sp. PS1159 TaxID=55785 RepID=A0AC35GDE4_9BILA
MESSSSSNDIICSFENEWTFKKADLMDSMNKENSYLIGKYFYAYNIPGLQYFVGIHPNGFGEETRGETWLFFLIKCLEDRKVDFSLSLGVESANLSKASCCILGDSIAINVCKTEEFLEYKSKYFVNGEIIFKIKGAFKTERSLIPIVSAPISMEWKKKEYDLKCTMEESNNEHLYSEGITIASFSDTIYYLSICPNYINAEKQSETVLYFYIELKK